MYLWGMSLAVPQTVSDHIPCLQPAKQSSVSALLLALVLVLKAILKL